jgi:ADP-heptose:LPS heptosyltransferase
MSNILIIKHGSLGDIAQISGVIKDIKENNNNNKIFILTTTPYIELLSRCPFLDGVLLDQRLPRWNIIYLLKLKKMLSKFNFTKVFDLQNSSRTSFYRRFLLNSLDWSSSETTLVKGEKKEDFDEHSVLQRFETQLIKSDIKTKHVLNPDFSWARINVDKLVNKYFGKKFILVFPFCSSKLTHKKWLYYNDLIDMIKSKHKNIEIAVAPGPNEIDEAKKLKAVLITNNNLPLNIMELAGLISKADFVIANDTGPAHMSAHLGKKGIVLFGYHTTAKKVSIQTEKFRALSVDDLKNLTPEEVYANIKDELMLID